MNCRQCVFQTDKGPDPYVANIEQMAVRNPNFRTAIWTGCHMQMTIMSIPPCGEIGQEIHQDTDQLIRVEQGKAEVMIGKCEEKKDFHKFMCKGDAVFIPAGSWHNIINVGRIPLMLLHISVNRRADSADIGVTFPEPSAYNSAQTACFY